MKNFMDENFLLSTETAKKLYHDYAKDLPIIDYHNHLPPADIDTDRKFENLTRIWLEGDHYKWRAMRANGIDEKFCTGDADDRDKFIKWAETVPFTIRNPLYHWTHMELRNPFGIDKLLNSQSAVEIYDECNEKLASDDFSVRSLLKKRKVEVICTTDDPIDDLKHHKNLQESDFEIRVLPTFRPDKVLKAENPDALHVYFNRLEELTEIQIKSMDTLLDALKKRHDHFAEYGCILSDHGLEYPFSEHFTGSEIDRIIGKIRKKIKPEKEEITRYKSALLHHLALMDHEKGWVQQFHLGALRNNNTRMLHSLGPDTGFDSIGDFEMGVPLSRFLDRLDRENKLAKTILYNLNPADNALFASMTGNFNDGSVAGKMQWGAAWWFLDQKDGIREHLNILSNMGLLSHFVGMLTDSRSFLSYSRHEYFRRVLCDMIGKDVENGEIPNDDQLLKKLVQDISYYNAKAYFGF